MECVPPASVEVVNAAFPALSATEVSVVALSLKVTVPAGVPEVAVTVAVNVTDWSKAEGFAEEVTEVEVAAGFTLALTPTTSVYGEAGTLFHTGGGPAQVKSSVQGSLGLKLRF